MEFITAGGQGPVYKWKDFALKFHEDDSILRKMNSLRKRMPSETSMIPASLRNRTFMIGSGTAAGSDIKSTTSNFFYVLVFPWLEGEPLKCTQEYSNTPRNRMASTILEGLLFLENIGVVHADLNPENYLVDRNGIANLIDIEGAGLYRLKTQEWEHKPAVYGKKVAGFPTPPEKQKDESIVNMYTDRWFGLTLISAVLTGNSPFKFLSRTDYDSLQLLRETAEKGYENKGLVAWPPYGVENHPYLHDILKKKDALAGWRKFWASQASGRLTPMLFSTFIRGMNEPVYRAKFKQMKIILGLA